MNVDSMKELFIHELKDLHDAENQILKALPKMAEKASHTDLKNAFEEHERQTEEHVRRLERVLDDLGEKAGGVKCKGIRGIISEGEESMEADDDDVRDAGMIAAAQRVEHYEIAGYGTARTYARVLGDENAVRLLQQTLDEEGATDKKLTTIAEAHVNRDALKG
ncbi:MAG TPA: ferritin-like domain-containing protein [Longimicrobiales bacterium]|nr:ferritin-like domain-containing protein [Longimicrobiales bacterium]